MHSGRALCCHLSVPAAAAAAAAAVVSVYSICIVTDGFAGPVTAFRIFMPLPAIILSGYQALLQHLIQVGACPPLCILTAMPALAGFKRSFCLLV